MSLLKKIKIIQLTSVTDDRGTLTVMEGTKEIPFEIKRIFFVHNILKERGGHAHLDTEQVVIAVHGSFDVELFDGKNYKNLHLNNPEKGLYMPPMIFITMTNFSPDSVCLVIANTHYDIKKSFRSKNEFISFIRNKK